MLERSHRLRATAFAVALCAALLASGPASAQAIVKVNDDVNFRLGLLAQGWADWNQDAASASS